MNGACPRDRPVIAGMIVWMGLRARARNGLRMEDEPMSFFILATC
jgi:hypothetical protein